MAHKNSNWLMALASLAWRALGRYMPTCTIHEMLRTGGFAQNKALEAEEEKMFYVRDEMIDWQRAATWCGHKQTEIKFNNKLIYFTIRLSM